MNMSKMLKNLLINNLIFKFLTIIFFIFYSFQIVAKNLEIKGLSRMSLDDIQSLTEVDIYSDSLNDSDISILIQDIEKSELILNSNLKIENNYVLNIKENIMIKDIFINGNKYIKDEVILNIISSKQSTYFNKNKISSDIDLIRDIYLLKGFNEISVVASTEISSGNRYNLIYEIFEGSPSKINSVIIKGNYTFSDRFLLSQIKTKPVNFLNFLTKGSDFSPSLFNNDINQLKFFYQKRGFNDVQISYSVEKNLFGNNQVIFYVIENDRSKIDKFINQTDFKDKSFDELFGSLKKEIKENNDFFDFDITSKYVEKINQRLIDNNILDKQILFDVKKNNDEILLVIYQSPIDKFVVNQINIFGNTITKDSVIRSKFDVEPGDYLHESKLKKIDEQLSSLPYINLSKSTYKLSEKGADLLIDIEENKKTGNFMVAGTISGDTGAGASIGLNDKNIFGSGNALDFSINLNSESALFKLIYSQFLINNPKLINTYKISNEENDYVGSYGYKVNKQEIGYSIKYQQSENLDISIGYSISKNKGHSAKYDDLIITDNIGTFYNSIFNLSLSHDNLNDIFFPTNGSSNNLSITFSPENISDNSFYKISYNGSIYKNIRFSENYFFINNRIGFAESLNSRLSTINSYSLGGNNFKGFDYRGVGKKNPNNIYVGGNKFFSSAIGYGSSLLFDKRDNLYYKIFYSTGSIWDNDYLNESLKLRSSIGLSIDFLTAVGPISFSYTVPIQKENYDNTRNFNFSIGTSF